MLKGSNRIVTETNVALDGKSLRVAGLFAKDSDTGSIVLLHRGKVGGGRKGIGKTAFLSWYKGPTVSFIYTAKPDRPEHAIKVADLGAADVAKQIGEFVIEVSRFKSEEIWQKTTELSDSELTKKAKASTRKPKTTASVTTSFARNPYVSEYAKRRAKGMCDLCRSAAPFIGSDGNPYLECHHIDWLANSGSDAIENTVALCPNCHRRMHIVKDPKDIKKLKNRATQSL
ncbi:MAG: HNH endonuclease [Gammaproteobacteria bacterium]